MMITLISSPSPFYLRRPQLTAAIHLLTYIHVADLVGPDTAGMGDTARPQSRPTQRVWPADVRHGWARTLTWTRAKE